MTCAGESCKQGRKVCMEGCNETNSSNYARRQESYDRDRNEPYDTGAGMLPWAIALAGITGMLWALVFAIGAPV